MLGERWINLSKPGPQCTLTIRIVVEALSDAAADTTKVVAKTLLYGKPRRWFPLRAQSTAFSLGSLVTVLQTDIVHQAQRPHGKASQFRRVVDQRRLDTCGEHRQHILQVSGDDT
ncbi:hypothetical protein D9M71_693980 [compost metagenome]